MQRFCLDCDRLVILESVMCYVDFSERALANLVDKLELFSHH